MEKDGLNDDKKHFVNFGGPWVTRNGSILKC